MGQHCKQPSHPAGAGAKGLDEFTEPKQLSVIETRAPVSHDDMSDSMSGKGKDTTRKTPLAAAWRLDGKDRAEPR